METRDTLEELKDIIFREGRKYLITLRVDESQGPGVLSVPESDPEADILQTAYGFINCRTVEVVRLVKLAGLHGCVMLVDEEGKYTKGEQLNRKATYISDIAFSDYICGDALICRETEEDITWFSPEEAEKVHETIMNVLKRRKKGN